MLARGLVDSLFARLQVRYGDSWTRMWNGVDIDAVKTDWATELAGYSGRLEAIEHALNHLPSERPPNVSQFASLCRGAPRPQEKQLKAPRADNEKVLAAVGKALAGQAKGPALEWANRLRIREQNCERLTPAQRQMWRSALKEKT